MHLDFLDDILVALERVFPVDAAALKEILILSGMPEETENLRYLAYNRQVVARKGRNLEFSAVAVLNNRRVPQWRLEGFRRTVSHLIFYPLWARRNPMDLFLNTLRCNATLMNLLGASPNDYTLLGLMQVEWVQRTGSVIQTQPVIALPGLEGAGLDLVAAFEKHCRIHA